MISSTCFGQTFTHLQKRKTEIFTAYGILQRWIYRKLCSFLCDVLIIINVIKTGGCVVLYLGIGDCMLIYVVKFYCVISCSGLEGYCAGEYGD